MGIIGLSGEKPVIFGKKIKIETAILFLSFFWSKITVFW